MFNTYQVVREGRVIGTFPGHGLALQFMTDDAHASGVSLARYFINMMRGE